MTYRFQPELSAAKFEVGIRSRFRGFMAIMATFFVLGWTSACTAAMPAKQLSNMEKAAFDEAEGLFPRKVLPKTPPSHGERIFWLDDRRAIFSSRSLGDWKAATDELSKIVILDTERAQVVETRYSGELMCLNPEKMLVREYPAPWESYLRRGDERGEAKRHYIVGRYGEDLAPIEIPREHGFISQITCESYSSIDESLGREYRVQPLRHEHGYFARASFVESKRVGYWLFSPQKREAAYFPSEDCEGGKNVQFVPWEGRYWISGTSGMGFETCPKRAWLIAPDGKSEIINAPDIFDKWVREGIVGFRMAWTKVGVVFMVDSHRGYGERSGIYWQDGKGRLRRIFRGEAGVFKVSPDGCRMLLAYYPGTRMDARGAIDFETITINFCSGKQ
jgi:hypothetical protein